MAAIRLYSYSGLPYVVDKTLTEQGTIEGGVNTSLNCMDAEVIIRGDLPDTVNYVYIDYLSRYYFVTETEAMSGSRYKVHLKIDVLNTYKDLIKKSTGLATYGEHYNKFLSGVNMPYDIRPQIETIQAENPKDTFNEAGTIIMVTINGTRNQ